MLLSTQNIHTSTPTRISHTTHPQPYIPQHTTQCTQPTHNEPRSENQSRGKRVALRTRSSSVHVFRSPCVEVNTRWKTWVIAQIKCWGSLVMYSACLTTAATARSNAHIYPNRCIDVKVCAEAWAPAGQTVISIPLRPAPGCAVVESRRAMRPHLAHMRTYNERQLRLPPALVLTCMNLLGALALILCLVLGQLPWTHTSRHSRHHSLSHINSRRVEPNACRNLRCGHDDGERWCPGVRYLHDTSAPTIASPPPSRTFQHSVHSQPRHQFLNG